jgi:extradiol dioxygenase family protein
MRVIGLDHLVVNVKDMDAALEFYGDVLGLEVLRLDQFRRGQVGFVSVRVSGQSLIDLRPSETSGAAPASVGANVDHFCLVLEPTDMAALMENLKGRGIAVAGPVSPRWGSAGNGPSFYLWDPEGNKIELKCYRQ